MSYPFIQDIQTLFTFLGMLAGGLATIYGLWKWPVYPIVLKIRNFTRILSDVAEIHNIIKYEFKANGGLSLRDAINRIEERQVMSENKNRVILNYSGIALYETDAEGLCVWANRNYIRLLDRSLDELLGNGWTNCIIESDRERVFDAWQNAVHQNREFICAYKLINGGGDVLAVNCEAMPIRNKVGKIVGYFGSVRPTPVNPL